MRTVLIIFCSLLSTGIFAQLEVGSTWYVRQFEYNFLWPSKSYDTTQVIRVVKDTTINDLVYHRITGKCRCAGEYNFIRSQGTRWYYRHQEADHLLYDFSLVPGDTLKIWMPWKPSQQDSVYAIIDSIGTKVINGNTVAVQYFSYGDLPSNFRADFGEYIIKDIGSNSCLFPEYGLCENGTRPLLCYESPSTGLLKFVPGNCILSATTDLEAFASIQLTYDDNQQQLTFSTDRNFDTPQLLVTALSGRVMLRQPIATQRQSFSVAALPSGLYFATVLVDNRAVRNIKFVKLGD